MQSASILEGRMRPLSISNRILFLEGFVMYLEMNSASSSYWSEMKGFASSIPSV